MKVILSRKGFDSHYGGCCSPILPDGRIIPLPIPYKGEKEIIRRYKDLRFDSESTYLDLMHDLHIERVFFHKGESERLGEDTTCHLDPDIRKSVIDDRPDGWQPAFGQNGAAQTHLNNQKVDCGDLFLFFGTFKEAECKASHWKFKYGVEEKHVIFGYLQVGKKLPLSDDLKEEDKRWINENPWIKKHPHYNEIHRKKCRNTIYIARPELDSEKNLPGAGTFICNKDNKEFLVLTKDGLTKSQWELPEFFRKEKIEISYHPKGEDKKYGWHNDYFQSANIGQEFVIQDDEDDEEAEKWAKNLIKKCKSVSS